MIYEWSLDYIPDQKNTKTAMILNTGKVDTIDSNITRYQMNAQTVGYDNNHQ
jgi:hypothetical protein